MKDSAFVFPPETLSEQLTWAIGITAVGFVFYLLLFQLLKRWTKQKQYFVPRLLEEHIRFPGMALVTVLLLTADLNLLGTYLYPRLFNFLDHLMRLLIIGTSSFLIIRSITVLREILLHHYKSENPIDFTLRKAKTKFQLMQRAINFLIIVFTVSIMLMTFQSIRNIGSTLLASAGVVGLVIGFAAQKSLSTLIAGIQIAISQPIRLDDTVVVENTFGTVGEITLTYVVINSWDGKRLIVPINYFLEEPFENWTRKTPEVVGKVYLWVDFSLPVDELRQEFYRWLDASPLWDKRKRALIIHDATDKVMKIRATMSAANSDDSFDLEVMVREKMITFINENYPDAWPQVRLSSTEDEPPLPSVN